MGARRGGREAALIALPSVGRHDALSIASLLAPHQQLRIVLTGGLLRSQSLERVGTLAEDTYNAVNVSIAILGADGVSAESGFTTHDDTEARTNHAMVAKASLTIVVADSSKVGQVALARMADMSEVDTFMMDSRADPAMLDRLREAGVEVIAVEVPEVE